MAIIVDIANAPSVRTATYADVMESKDTHSTRLIAVSRRT